MCDAIKLGHLAVVDEFMKHGFTPSTALQGNHARKLLESLVGVARAGRWEEVLDIISQLPPFTIQLARTFKELLRVALGARGGQDVARILLENMVSLLCSVLANWSSLPCEEQYSFLSLLRTTERHLLITRTFGPIQRLISFCCSRQHSMDTLVHLLCATGYSEGIKLLMDSSGPGGALLEVEDSMQLGPHFYAIYGGHLNVLTVGRLSSPPLLACIGALLYFSMAPHVHLTAQTQFAVDGLTSAQRRYVQHNLNALKPGRCSFSTLYKDPTLVHAYLRTVVSVICGETCSKLLYAQGEHLFHPVLLLCLIPNLEPLHPLMEEIRNCLQDHSVEVSTQSILMEGSGITEEQCTGLHPLQVILERALSMFARAPCSGDGSSQQHTCHTVMDLAVSFASAQTRRTGAALLEDILAEYAHSVPLVTIHKAARRGLWKVVDVASRRIPKLQETWSFYTLANKEVANNYYAALSTALRQGKMEVAASIYDTFLLAVDESESCKQEWENRLLHLAIKYCLLDRIAALMHGNEYVFLGKRRTSLLEAAAYYGRTEVVQFLLHAGSLGAGSREELFNSAAFHAAKQNHTGVLKYLQEQVADVPQHCAGRALHGYAVPFWYQVLLGAAEGGHPTLAARAVEAIPLDNWDQLSSRSEYFKILHWCGYWGMHDLFRRIPFAPSHIFVRLDDGWESAWESAVANGHIGELYDKVPSFPCFTEYVETRVNGSLVGVEAEFSSYTKEAVVDSMLTGSFHRMMVAASTPSPNNPEVPTGDLCCMSKRLSSLTGHCGFFYYGCKYAVLSIVDACVTTLGRMAGRVLQYLYEEIGVCPLHHVCKRKGSSRVLQALVKTLRDTNLSHVASLLDKAGDTPLALASRTGELESVKSLLQCEPRSTVYHTNRYSGDSVLHEAVMGGNCEVMEVLCHALGSDVVECCFADNKVAISPLQLAFALGHHEQAALLIEMVGVGDERLRAPAITDISRNAFGWFSLHLGKNSRETAHVQVRVPTNYLSKHRKFRSVKKTLREALKVGHSALAMCIVEASVGFAIDNNMVGFAALDPQVMSYIIKNHCISERTLKSHMWTIDICLALRNGRAEDAIRVIQFVHSEGVQIDWERIFDVAQTAPSVIPYLLQSQIHHVAPPDLCQKAIGVAAALGNLDSALLLLHHSHFCESKYQTYKLPHLPPIAELLLSTPLSHEGILRALFHSTVKDGAALSQQWLFHQWTETEVRLVS